MAGNDDAFGQVEEALCSGGSPAGFEFLADKFLKEKNYPALFEARLMQKRHELDLPLIDTPQLGRDARRQAPGVRRGLHRRRPRSRWAVFLLTATFCVHGLTTGRSVNRRRWRKRSKTSITATPTTPSWRSHSTSESTRGKASSLSWRSTGPAGPSRLSGNIRPRKGRLESTQLLVRTFAL